MGRLQSSADFLQCLPASPPQLSRTESAPAADKRLIQMIASTCLLIAAKFSDRKLPPLSELEKVHHGKASADEFAQLELQILQGLRWKLHVPLPHVFTEHLKALCAGAPFTPAIEDRMHFFIDLSVYGARPTIPNNTTWPHKHPGAPRNTPAALSGAFRPLYPPPDHNTAAL